MENSSHSKSILCVEDDRDTCAIFSILFAGYEFVSAYDLKEAFALIGKRDFDLYILDNWLPDGSGVDLCRAIRAKNTEVPIIFVSGVAYEKYIHEAKEAGATKYLVKPCDVDVLEKLVKELLEKSSAEARDIPARNVF